MTKIFLCKNVEDTHKVAKELALDARAGSVFCLQGNLGAGKTEFAKGFIKALCGENVVVTSPTFNIVQIYDVISRAGAPNGGGLKVYHYDLYRLKSDGELEEIGVSESFNDAINIVEWPEIAEEYLPKNSIWVEIRNAKISDTNEPEHDGIREIRVG